MNTGLKIDLNELGLGNMSEELGRLFPETAIPFEEILKMIFQGKVSEAVSLLVSSIGDKITVWWSSARGMILAVLLIALLSVLFSLFFQSFENKQTAKLGEYLSLFLMLTLMTRTFQECYELMAVLLTDTSDLAKLLIPAWLIAVGTASGSITAAGYYPVYLLLLVIVEWFLSAVCLPLTGIHMLFVAVNSVWEEEKLHALMDFLEKILRTVLKWIMTCVAGAGLLQSMVNPVLDELKRGTATKLVSALPGIGGLAEGAGELLLGSAVLVKNGVGIFIFLLMLFLCAVPFLKVLQYGLILKGSAALAGIIADKKLITCVNRAGDNIFLLMQVAGTGAACFLIMVAIVTCMTG